MRVLSFVLATCCILVCASSAAGQDWHVETLLPFATFYEPSIAIGDDHIVHMAASSNINGTLLYASKINGAWQYEVVTEKYSAVYGARALRFGPGGRARILAGTYVYTQTATGWDESWPLLTWMETATAMAIDKQGVTRFCNTSYISYTGYSSVSYDAHVIAQAATFPTASACEMEFTSDGRPNIVALPSSTRPLAFYRAENDGAWTTEVIGPGLYPSMAIDASDRVHVCYSTINKELIYATRVSLDQWNSERVDESVHGTHPSLAVASNGRVCVSYYDPDHGELKFASKGRGETRWHITTVDTGVKETGFYSASSIAVGQGSVHIGYVDTYDRLRYATGLVITAAGSLPALDGASIRAVPNPFNPSTMIEYVVPARGRVRVSVYDAAGRMLERLVDDVRGAGSYRVPYRSRAASGVYFARVEVGGRSATTKIVLLK